MIKFNLKALISDKEFREGRKINYEEISEYTGISRPTLSKIATKRGYNITSDNIEKICNFFGCRFDDFMTIVHEENSTKEKDKL
ncbi:MAG: transcriptional regulator [Deltaproteobacteria bacterium]|nr:MAG: transcriptional regulator [Deltaproteobacteria bacterium]